MAQMLVDNRLMKTGQAVKAGPSQDNPKGPSSLSRVGPNKRQRRSRVSLVARVIVNPLHRASGEYRPTELPLERISTRSLMPSITEEVIYMTNSTVETAMASSKDITPTRSIGSFQQLTESFVARFIINAKAPKGVGSLLTLKKGKKQGCLAYALKRKENLEAKSIEFQPVAGDHEVIKEPPQNAKTVIAALSQAEFFSNKAEYEAFITGLQSASKLKVFELHIFNDSKLVVNQVMEKFEARGAKMAKYLAITKALLTEFKAVIIEQARRDLNSHADALAGLASMFEGEVGRTIIVDLILAPSLERTQESILVNTKLGPSWIDPIVNFMLHDQLQEDKKEAYKIWIKITWFWISPNRNLYQKLYLGPYLLCIHPSLVEDVLFEINEGICKLHSRGKIISLLGSDSGILVAIYSKKTPKCTSTSVPSASFSLLDPSASKGLDTPYQSMALCPMGIGHCGGPAPSSKEQEILVGSNGLLHEMGKG
ncbi:hypothetical protein Acr_00g0018250 [Actinidia rufa]|uniref:RNase H type-1 domain-containing protein n=1 Tax=Actinidia rufa TaxID=165716 RepID=A0A7J0DD88_9ERIC|nr:hypothetical protein Acr_00g0018250 [Actinidia rufa]